MMKSSNAIDLYIDEFQEPVKSQLQHLRTIIQKTIPEAEEIISYKMPAYKMKTVLVYFAGYKNHIGFYPTPSGIKKFQKDFDEMGYTWSKGAVQFPVDKKLPIKLIEQIIKFRVKEDEKK